MTQPEQPTPPRDNSPEDRLDDAVSWFVGRDRDEEPESGSATPEFHPGEPVGREPAGPAADEANPAQADSVADEAAEESGMRPAAAEAGESGEVGEGVTDKAEVNTDRDSSTGADADPPGPGTARWHDRPASTEPADSQGQPEAPRDEQPRDGESEATADAADAITSQDAETQIVPDSEPERLGAPRPLFRDESIPPAAGAAGVAGAGVGAAAASSYDDAEATRVVSADDAATTAADRRAARDRQLGRVEPLAEVPAQTVVPYAVPSTYSGFPSFGFLLLRVVVAGLLGFRAFQQLMDLPAAHAIWEGQRLPQPGLVTWIMIGLEIAIALMLLFGLATRVAGLLLAVLAIGIPLFTLWGAVPWVPAGTFGFTGELWVLLAVVGIFFFTSGGGRAGVDGAIHAGRIQRKNDKLVASN